MKIKRYIAGIILIGCVVALTGCFTDNNHGYPYTVTFPKEGGTKVIKGDTFFTNIEIRDSHFNTSFSDRYWAEDPSISVTHDWLTVEQVSGTNTLILTAKPMEGKKTRKLTVNAIISMDIAEIIVKQKK